MIGKCSITTQRTSIIVKEHHVLVGSTGTYRRVENLFTFDVGTVAVVLPHQFIVPPHHHLLLKSIIILQLPKILVLKEYYIFFCKFTRLWQGRSHFFFWGSFYFVHQRTYLHLLCLWTMRQVYLRFPLFFCENAFFFLEFAELKSSFGVTFAVFVGADSDLRHCL
jgi:hypothetical protein